MQVWNVLRAARWKYRTQKIARKSPSGHHPTTLSGYIFATIACIDNRKKNLLSNSISSTCPHNMVNFGPLTAEIISLVWGSPANLNGFRALAALLHGTLVVSVSQSLRRWTEGATYIRQGGHQAQIQLYQRRVICLQPVSMISGHNHLKCKHSPEKVLAGDFWITELNWFSSINNDFLCSVCLLKFLVITSPSIMLLLLSSLSHMSHSW